LKEHKIKEELYEMAPSLLFEAIEKTGGDFKAII
jgi:hypothetical protein